MFALFFSLYLAMFSGTWNNLTWSSLFWQNTSTNTQLKNGLNTIGQLITSILNSDSVTNLGDVMIDQSTIMTLIAFILALITSIGIVVMAVKGIKRIFAVFFTLGR